MEPSLIREQLFKSKENNYEGEENEGTEEEENEKTIEVVEEVQTEEEDAEINQRIRFNNILQKLEIGKLAVQVKISKLQCFIIISVDLAFYFFFEQTIKKIIFRTRSLSKTLTILVSHHKVKNILK